MSYNLVSTLAPSFLIGLSSFLQVTRTTIKSRMSLKFGWIQPWTAELAALDQFKKSLNLLLENYSKYFDDLLSGERSLPFGLLVSKHLTLKVSQTLKVSCYSQIQTVINLKNRFSRTHLSTNSPLI